MTLAIKDMASWSLSSPGWIPTTAGNPALLYTKDACNIILHVQGAGKETNSRLRITNKVDLASKGLNCTVDESMHVKQRSKALSALTVSQINILGFRTPKLSGSTLRTTKYHQIPIACVGGAIHPSN